MRSPRHSESTEVVTTLFRTFQRTGDRAALAGVFDAAAPNLLLLATAMCGSRNEAEDHVQNTFLDAIRHAAECDTDRPVLPWLIGILTNRVRRERHKTGRRIDHSRIQQADPDDPLAVVAGAELHETILQVLDRFKPHYRAVLVLRLVDGMTTAEIATRLGTPIDTAKTRLRRGLELLRRVLLGDASEYTRRRSEA